MNKNNVKNLILSTLLAVSIGMDAYCGFKLIEIEIYDRKYRKKNDEIKK